MTRSHVCWAILGMALCSCDVVETSTTEQDLANEQGISMQGISMQGISMQGMNLLGFRVDNATLSGEPLGNVRVQKGEVVADRSDGSTVRGTGLVGARFKAQVRDASVNPPRSALADFRITAISPELDKYDPTDTGRTYLYTLEQRVPETSQWVAACPVDEDGRRVAIPLAAIFDEHGERIASSSMFTFGCTTGVIAKCYRWGYRPWVGGYGDLTAMHWTCTRLARADYCGNGVPHTRDGTEINVWDRLPSPGPIQRHGGLLGVTPPLGMLFEAGWNTGGAVCMSTKRWLLDDALEIGNLCPSKLVPPGLLLPTVCDTITAVLVFDPNARMFNESYLINL